MKPLLVTLGLAMHLHLYCTCITYLGYVKNHIWDSPLILLLIAPRSGCPLPALALLCFSSGPFKALTAFLPFWISCDRSAAAFQSCGRHVAGWKRMETLCKVAELNVQPHSPEQLV